MQKWFVRTNPTQYPDLFTYDVLEENPEPAKYQGIKEFGVASGLDSKENAHLIAASPNMYEALIKARAVLASIKGEEETFTLVHEAITKAEGK